MPVKAITVSQLTAAVKRVLEDSFGTIAVSGEISNYKLHASGHRYFTLKDEQAQIACTMWRSRQPGFEPVDGMKVVVTGSLSVYPPRGNYQIDCYSIHPLGKGDLWLAYEALKLKLEGMGYFDPDRKKPLPEMPLHVGIATSPTGAALHDMVSTVSRRFPLCTIYFRPTLVQGDEAFTDIARAISDLNSTPAQVIIVGRGGGSIEDLWAFNTESVANAIFRSATPIISAVGHETDFTIADFVADRRAATPTAAAELVTKTTLEDIIYRLDTHRNNSVKSISSAIDSFKRELRLADEKYMSRRLTDRIGVYMKQIDDAESRLKLTAKSLVSAGRQRFNMLESHLKSLHPLAPLNRGFAIIHANGKLVPADKSLANYKLIEIIRQSETALAKIQKILPKSLFLEQ